MDYTMNPMTSPIIRYPWSMTGLNNHITVTEETGLTLAMSYMTEILNSQSMKVSSGYETLSFSTYCQKRGTEGTCEVMLLRASSIIWWRHLEKKDWICYSEPIFNLFLPVQCKATYTKKQWLDIYAYWTCHTYPEWPPLSILKHSEHTLIKLHRAIKLSEVVIVDLLQLRRKEEPSKHQISKSPTSKQTTRCVRIRSSHRVEFYHLGLAEVPVWVLQLL